MDKEEGRKSGFNMSGINGFVMVGQLGLSLLMPLLLCLLLCYILTSRAGFGGWIYIPGFFFGIGGSMMTAYKLYRSEVRKASKKRGISKNKNEVSYSRHL